LPSSHLLNLTKGLIYPAFLGAALLWFSEYVVNYLDKDKLTSLMSEPVFYLSIWLLLYFFVPFTNLHLKIFVSNYGTRSFILDIVDVLIIFAAFYNLGLIGNHAANLNTVTIALIFIPVVGFVSNAVVDNSETWKVTLSVITFCLFLLFALIGVSYALINFIIIYMMYALLLFYMLFSFDA